LAGIASPAPQLHDTPIAAAKAFVHAGRRGARGLRALGWSGAALLITAAALLVLAVSRNREQDLVAVGLDTAPIDDEKPDSAEDAAVAKARTEQSIQWERERQDLSREGGRR